MSTAKYPPPGRIGLGSKGLSRARTQPGTRWAPKGSRRPLRGEWPTEAGAGGPAWIPALAGPGARPDTARLDQLWTVKSALTVAGVPSCTW